MARMERVLDKVVILSEAKDLLVNREILRCAQNDRLADRQLTTGD
jgi:hypothetical protein